MIGLESEYIGRKITGADFTEKRLRLSFEGGAVIEIFDAVQPCCERRYMTTDDDVATLVGNSLLKIEAKPGPREGGHYEVHETCFVEVATDKGFVTMTNHNKHSGYYSGFGLSIRKVRGHEDGGRFRA